MTNKTVTGDKIVINNLKKKSKMDQINLRSAIQTGTLLIFNESQKQVPVDQGILRASIYKRVFEKAKEIIGEVGYSALYAIFVHENPRAGKTEGISPKGQLYRSWAERGKWKFLEDPYKMYYNTILRMIKKAVGK